MNIRDLLGGLFWLALSVFVCIQSIQLHIGTYHTPGAGFFPFWSGVALGIFSITIIAKSILKRKGQQKITNLWKGIQWNKVILVFSSLYIYAALLTGVGYLIATFGLMTVLFGLMGRPKLWIQVMGAFITVLATYVFFHVWLEVQLPKGIFGF